jgi:hypothetical protein
LLEFSGRVSIAARGARARKRGAAARGGRQPPRFRARAFLHFVENCFGNEVQVTAKAKPMRSGASDAGAATGDLEALARAHTEAAIQTLVGLMADDATPAGTRLAAATALLDRGWGKAAQAERRTRRPAIDELSDEELVRLIWDGAGSGRAVGKAAGAEKL